MSKAAALLREVPLEKSKKSSTPCLSVDGSEMLTLPLHDSPVTAQGAADIYRDALARYKEAETELEALKQSLRIFGQHLLDKALSEGEYYPKVDVCGVSISRANKFYPVPYPRDALMDAVGETEYRLMFTEKACIEFKSIDKMREHVTMCKDAGVDIGGECKEVVAGTPKLVEFISKTAGHLDADRTELLKACARDQSLRVGGK